MARTKQRAPLQREPSDFSHCLPSTPDQGWKKASGDAKANESLSSALAPMVSSDAAGLVQLIICAGGIYASL
jgi:hypothetical protein